MEGVEDPRGWRTPNRGLEERNLRRKIDYNAGPNLRRTQSMNSLVQRTSSQRRSTRHSSVQTIQQRRRLSKQLHISSRLRVMRMPAYATRLSHARQSISSTAKQAQLTIRLKRSLVHFRGFSISDRHRRGCGRGTMPT